MSTKSSTIYFATSSRHKFDEAKDVLSRYRLKVKMVRARRLEIQHNSIRSISESSLKDLMNRVKERPLVVEDAGLYIHILNGFPGPYSSYVFKTLGTEGILRLMKNFTDRRAVFKSVVSFLQTDNIIRSFEGSVKGVIAEEHRGSKGFGFDPIFIPYGCDRTFGEMNLKEKNLHSHRARSFTKLAEYVLRKSF